LASPNGSTGAPTFRAIVAQDIPTLNQNTTGTASNVTGTVAVSNGGTGLTSLTANRIPYGNGTSAYQSSSNLTFNGTTLTANDITDSSLTDGRVTYAGTGGNLVDSAAFTYSNTGLKLSVGTAGTALTGINQNNTNEASISFWSNNVASPTQLNDVLVGMDNTANGGGGFLWNRNNSYLKFGTNNSERGRFDATGNLLVGTTTSPTGFGATPAIVASGSINAGNGATGGFFTSTYATNTSNNIWAFANAQNYGLKYFQGTSGTAINGGNADTIALPFGQTTSSASFFQFVCNGSTLGALKQTNQPAFRASLTNNGDQTLTNSVLPFNIEAFDKSSNFDTGTYSFTAPIAGTYFFYVQTYGTSSGGAATMYNAFQVNGTSVSPANGDINIGGGSSQIGIAPIQTSMTINLSAGDTVRVFASAYNNAGLYRIFTGNSIFTGWLIG
jgi:hypothetical protein